MVVSLQADTERCYARQGNSRGKHVQDSLDWERRQPMLGTLGHACTNRFLDAEPRDYITNA